MKPAWAYVIREMKNIMDIHPTIKGIQVMNDQGEYLIKAYAGRGKWAPDTTSTREGILDMIKNSTNLGYSRSNPTKGIRTAITNHYIQGRKISIYLLGDDIMSSNVDVTLDQIDDHIGSWSNVFRLMGQGLTFRFGDEITAGVRALGGEDYDKAVAEERRRSPDLAIGNGKSRLWGGQHSPLA